MKQGSAIAEPFLLAYSASMQRKSRFYHEGISAFELGMHPSKNPYSLTSSRGVDWLAGYRDAHDEFIADDISENLGIENETLFGLVFHQERFPE